MVKTEASVELWPLGLTCWGFVQQGGNPIRIMKVEILYSSYSEYTIRILEPALYQHIGKAGLLIEGGNDDLC